MVSVRRRRMGIQVDLAKSGIWKCRQEAITASGDFNLRDIDLGRRGRNEVLHYSQFPAVSRDHTAGAF